MVDYIYKDILMSKDDLTLDQDREAVIIYDRDVVLQDIIHAIRESHLLVLMISERDYELRLLMLGQLKSLVEEDPRVIPGTVEIVGDAGNYLLSADTYEFGKITNVGLITERE